MHFKRSFNKIKSKKKKRQRKSKLFLKKLKVGIKWEKPKKISMKYQKKRNVKEMFDKKISKKCEEYIIAKKFQQNVKENFIIRESINSQGNIKGVSNNFQTLNVEND